jgi:hypothetical protein
MSVFGSIPPKSENVVWVPVGVQVISATNSPKNTHHIAYIQLFASMIEP